MFLCAQSQFTETFIDHLDIESRIIVAECGEARLQVRRFGLPPLIGDPRTDSQLQYNIRIITKGPRMKRKFSSVKKFSKKI